MEPIEIEYKNGIHLYAVNPKGEWTLGIQWFNYGVYSEDEELKLYQEKCLIISLIIFQIKIGRACREVE